MAALSAWAASRAGWTTGDTPDRLTAGLRDAYHNGLAVAFPVGPETLGWAMDPAPTSTDLTEHQEETP